jgi:hypothetical protein
MAGGAAPPSGGLGPSNNWIFKGVNPPANPATGGHFVKVGDNQWQLIHAVGPGKWAPGAPNANQQKINLANAAKNQAAGNNTNWMAPQSRNALQQQAVNTVTAQYKPQYDQISAQAQQAQNIYDKQQADNKSYEAWAQSQGNALQQHLDTSNQTLAALYQGIANQNQQQFNQTTGTWNATQADHPGNVSSGYNTGSGFATMQQILQADNQRTAAVQQRGLENAMSGSTQLASTINNLGNYIQAGAQKQTASYQTAMQQAANARTKAADSVTGAIAKEISRLQGIEIQKSQANRTYNINVQKLGLQALMDKSSMDLKAAQGKAALENASTASRNADTNAKNAQTRLTQVQIDAMNKDRQYNLDVQKFGAQQAKDNYMRTHSLGPYKPASSGLSQSGQNAVYKQISNAQSLAQELVNTYKFDGGHAYSIMVNGGYVHALDKNGQPITKWIPPVAGGQTIANAAYHSLYGTGLSAGDIKALQQMGIPNPTSRLR